MRNLFIVIALLSVLFSASNVKAVSNKGFRADMSFLDFEDITDFFHPHHKQVVHRISHANSPLEIVEAEVSDRGTVFFDGLSGAQNTYSVKVKNKSKRRILAYEITWVLKHPFEDYVFHKIHSNSIEPVKIGETQELKFRRSKHYRDDAYYYVEVSKVEFDDDESIWEAPDLKDNELHTRLEEVKEEIDAMEDDVEMDKLDDEALELLKQQYSNGDLLLDKETEGKVELEEIKSEKIEELKKIKEVKKEVLETSTGTVTTTKTLETKLSETEPILDPQELMKAVDELIRSQKEQNVILESDLVNPVLETKYETTSPVTETTIIDSKPLTETKSAVKTQVIEEVKSTIEETVDDLEYDFDDEDDFDDDFEDDDFDIDFGDDDDF